TPGHGVAVSGRRRQAVPSDSSDPDGYADDDAGVSMTRPNRVEVHLMSGEAGCCWAREQRAVAVGVDALRASATITLLLHRGASEVIVVKEVSEAYAYRCAHPETVLVGERGGLKVMGFDFGNSPTEIQRADVEGKCVTFTSTTGAQCLVDCLG